MKSWRWSPIFRSRNIIRRKRKSVVLRLDKKGIELSISFYYQRNATGKSRWKSCQSRSKGDINEGRRGLRRNFTLKKIWIFPPRREKVLQLISVYFSRLFFLLFNLHTFIILVSRSIFSRFEFRSFYDTCLLVLIPVRKHKIPQNKLHVFISTYTLHHILLNRINPQIYERNPEYFQEFGIDKFI